MKNNEKINLHEKEIYKLFNEMKFDESELNSMDEEVDIIQKERIKKNLNNKIKRESRFNKLKYTSVAAAITLAFSIGIVTASPTFAKNIPVLNSIMQILNNKYGTKVDYAKYSEIINKSVSNNGITITINEVIADDSKLVISYTLKSDKKIKDLEVFGLGRFLKINGKTFSSGGSSLGQYIDDYTYIGSEEIHTSIPEDKKFNVDLNITEVSDIKGKWNFAFSPSKEEIFRESAVFKPNQKLDFPDSNATIDKVVFSPIDTSIFITGYGKNKSIKAGPDGGMFDYNYWIAFDDNGIELIPKGLGGGEFDFNKHTFSSEMQYEKSKSIPKFLTIIPCKITPSGGGGVKSDENGKETPVTIKTKKPKEIGKVIDGVYPIELSQGKMGKLIINDIKTENNRTIVKYTAKGKAPYFQAVDLLIKDDKGECIKIKDYIRRKDEKNPNEFTKVFETLDPNKQYTIFTNDFDNVEFREDLKFKIELNK
ncbi:TPA: DUF4179 domain-containing protein [Clostridium botulinum]|uniref:DUF4179 domain-containing protein n=1 Tax=Clostridium TaxID=1485 RepID=UPI000772F913|nr:MULTISPECIES: DUF4179 domain-containing protein [Clostridium]AUM93964.1 anti-sigma factor [Clostridium sporogenes]AVQ51388.1 DUF4179 domain-containing protein [Clostridium botulinum]MCW6112430.1 DUF4179 domain-containing protein [Clostridium sporogenes]HBJ2615497.1 DUF4179 domain-containing protein [Clostridium botulinum]